MKNRRDRLERVSHIAQTLWRLQQARLAQKEAELAELRLETKASVEAIARIEPGVALERIKILSHRRLDIQEAIETLRVAALESGARAKLADKSLREADRIWRRQEAAAETLRLSAFDVSAPKGR